MQFLVLAESEQNNRRTIADALEVLRTKADFAEGDTAEIQLGMLKLPSGEPSHLIYVGFNSTHHQLTFFVSLPPASRFRAKLNSKAQYEKFEVGQLHGAVIDARGDVQLADGTSIRNVEVIPTRLPYNITALDWAIIRQTLAELGIEEACQYDPGEVARNALGSNWFSNSVDCSKLAGHAAPLLKSVQARIQDHERDFSAVSLQKIADTLRKFGMRIPTTRN